jgi:hypothetical protein
MTTIKKPRQYLESKEQQGVVAMYRKAQATGKIPAYYILTSINLTQIATPSQQCRLKAEGMVAGIPDLALFVARHGHGTLFIEMKAPRKKTTKDGGISETQLKIHENLRACGYKVVTCYSAGEAWDAIVDYLS